MNDRLRERDLGRMLSLLFVLVLLFLLFFRWADVLLSLTDLFSVCSLLPFPSHQFASATTS